MRTIVFPYSDSGGRGAIGLLLVVVLWALCEGAAAQPTPDVAAWTVPDSVTVGQAFILNVTASTPAHRAVGFPEADAEPSVFGDLTVLGRSRVHTRRVGAGYAIDSVAYTVRVSTPGAIRVPPLPVWVDAGVDTVVARTHPRTVHVSPRPADMASSLNDSGSSGVVFWGAWAAVAALLIGGGRFVWAHVRGDDVSTAPPDTRAEEVSSPYRAAVEQLEALRSAAGPDPAHDRCEAGARVLRLYLARRLDVSARTLTTDELLARLDAHPAVSPAAHQHVETVLRRADLVKFAGERPGAETGAVVLSAARAAVDEIDASGAWGEDAT